MRRFLFASVVLLVPSVSFAQTEEIVAALDQKLATIRYVRALQDPATGGFAATTPAGDAKPAPSLRATSAAARSLKYLTGTPATSAVPHADKAAAFVLSCFDPKTGGFADAPGGKPDVTLTSVGVMAAVELGVPREKFAKAMDYLKENAKSFEEVRIAAAGVEAWGVKDCPFDLKPWVATAARHLDGRLLDVADGGARELGSVIAFRLRLGEGGGAVGAPTLDAGQLPDGGWKKADAKGADLETSYRVMRAYHQLGARPAGAAKLREFLAGCRNQDGGYGVKPGEPSTVSGVYYAAIITHWLDGAGKGK